MAWKGRKHTPETIERMKVCRLGFTHTEETKAKMSKAHKGRKMTWGSKIGDALKKISKTDISIIREKLKNGEKVKNLAKEYGVHRTTISKIKKGVYDGQCN